MGDQQRGIKRMVRSKECECECESECAVPQQLITLYIFLSELVECRATLFHLEDEIANYWTHYQTPQNVGDQLQFV